MSKVLKYNLKDRIKNKGLTAMDIATKCQIHPQSVYLWAKLTQNDPSSIPSDKLKILSKIFECSMDDLYNTQILEPC
jgi:transcriptional regulator with XRE-family HTH domain